MNSMNIITQFCQLWQKKNVEDILSMMTNDCFYHNIPIDPVIGIDNIRTFIGAFLSSVDECEFRILDIAQSHEGTVLTERVDRFRLQGQWRDLPVMGVFEIRDGRIAKWRDYYDQASMMVVLTPADPDQKE